MSTTELKATNPHAEFYLAEWAPEFPETCISTTQTSVRCGPMVGVRMHVYIVRLHRDTFLLATFLLN
jgi:hypothetical protein